MLKLFWKTGCFWLWIVFLVIMGDQLSKLWAVNHLVFQHPLPILPGLNFTLALNTGAAFAFLDHASGWQNGVLGGLALTVSVVILYWLYQAPRQARWQNIALCLVMGGALGNAWDRFTLGYVVDFISLYVKTWHFAIFNIADSAICIGAFMLLIEWMWEKK